MNEQAALLEACRLHPEEDTPRLMLADYLQENGRELTAKYIRESISFANDRTPSRRLIRSKMGTDYRRWLESLFGIENSGTTHGDRYTCAGETWDFFIVNLGERRNCTLGIKRGLPETLHVTAPMLMERAAQLFRFPLKTCTVTDRKPVHDPDIGRWVWMSSSYPQKFSTWEDSPHHVPLPLTRIMRREEQSRVAFRTQKAALVTLHNVAFDFGLASLSGKGEPVSSSNCQDNTKS